MKEEPPDGYKGIWRTWYSNGQIKYEHKNNGERTWWRRNGSKRSEIVSVSPYHYIQYFENGRKQLEEKEGRLYIEWYKNGQKKTEIQQDEKDGHKYTTSLGWHSNGQKRTESHWVDGKKHGLFIQWDESGSIISEKWFFKGKQVSKEEYETRVSESGMQHKSLKENYSTRNDQFQ